MVTINHINLTIKDLRNKVSFSMSRREASSEKQNKLSDIATVKSLSLFIILTMTKYFHSLVIRSLISKKYQLLSSGTANKEHVLTKIESLRRQTSKW